MNCVHYEEGKRCGEEIPDGRIYCPKHEPKDGGGGPKLGGSGGSRGGGDILFHLPMGGGDKNNF